MKRIMIGASLLALAACGKPVATSDADIANNATDNNAAANVNAGATVSAPPAAEFANKVAASDRFEIESGQIAAEKASSAEVQAFGQMLVTDHRKSTEELKAAAKQANVSPNDVLDNAKDAMLATLRSAAGANLDQKFLEQQITAHEKALALLQAYAAGGDNEALRGFATKAATVVQGHLDKARSLKK